MAQSTLAAHHSPNFHSVLTESIRQFRERVCVIVDRAMEPELAHEFCSYEYPESSIGACDGFPCGDLSTVHDLESDQPLCTLHFLRVNLGRALAELEAQ